MIFLQYPVQELVNDIAGKANEYKLNIMKFKNYKTHACIVIDSMETLEDLEQLNINDLLEDYFTSLVPTTEAKTSTTVFNSNNRRRLK